MYDHIVNYHNSDKEKITFLIARLMFLVTLSKVKRFRKIVTVSDNK